MAAKAFATTRAGSLVFNVTEQYWQLIPAAVWWRQRRRRRQNIAPPLRCGRDAFSSNQPEVNAAGMPSAATEQRYDTATAGQTVWRAEAVRGTVVGYHAPLFISGCSPALMEMTG